MSRKEKDFFPEDPRNLFEFQRLWYTIWFGAEKPD